MKITITRPIELVASLPKGTIVLKSSPKGWVTWFWKEGSCIHVATTEDFNFETQDNVLEVELNKDEIQELAKLIK